MDMQELKKECESYIKFVNTNYPPYFNYFKNIVNFGSEFNKLITDMQYKELIKSFKKVDFVSNSKCCSELSKENIIDLVIEFFGKISPSLKERFINDLNNRLISIDDNNKNKCWYLSKMVDGKEVCFCKTTIKYTGTIYDVFTLVHEYFHSLTDFGEFRNVKPEIKFESNYVQETVSILVELICAEYFSSRYPVETKDLFYYRIYSEVFISLISGKTIVDYINMVMQGYDYEKIKNKFKNIDIIREVIRNNDIVFSVEHFIGTMSSINLIDSTDDLVGLLSNLYNEISRQNIKGMLDLLPLKMYYSTVVNVISKKYDDKKYK